MLVRRLTKGEELELLTGGNSRSVEWRTIRQALIRGIPLRLAGHPHPEVLVRTTEAWARRWRGTVPLLRRLRTKLDGDVVYIYFLEWEA